MAVEEPMPGIDSNSTGVAVFIFIFEDFENFQNFTKSACFLLAMNDSFGERFLTE